MNGTWQAHLQGADARHKLGTIVYLGAGEGQRLAPVLALGAERIVLVEPLLEATMELKARIATDPRCVLYPLAISDQEGQAPLHVFNLPDLSSLSPPGALTELFPGLRETGQRTVETRTLTSLLADLGLSGEGKARHILHLDSPGSEARILSQLGRDDTPFEFISLRCGAQPLYSASDSAEDLVGMIEALGYRLEACNSDDPDFPEYWMSLDHQARALSALKEKLSRAEESLAVLGDERTGLAQQLTQSQDALTQAKERIAELEAFVREGRQTASQQSAQMAEVREKLKGAEKSLEVVKREKGEIETRLTQANERITTLQADLKTQASHRASLEAERDKARDALGTSLRLQALQAGDLKDLQTKYQTLLEEKQSQDRLLQTITSRMSDAIGQLGTVAPKTGAAKTQAAKKPASRSGKAKSSPAKKGPRA
ncbi:hypothetical protein LZG00_20855 [Rhodobacteraceae bacterium LMO-12]|nr:hypothetical protein [Rhodobacteraceae bacterium LMO-JJ12]